MQKLQDILNDLSNKLNIEFTEKDMHYFTDGVSGAVVFSLKGKYLIKIFNQELYYKSQLEFLRKYNNYNIIQNVILHNNKYKYICCEFVEGTLYKYNKIHFNKVIEQVYDIVKHYRKYSKAPYGYLYEDKCEDWADFLELNVTYSSDKIRKLNISMDKVNKAIENIRYINPPKYLIHGDFGTHNFIVNKEKIYVIDPMPVVGDYLYDFYFAILSNVNIFKDVKVEDILSYFDRDMDYKKNLFLVVLYIRLCRCYAYNRAEFDTYLNLYNKLTKD